VGSAVEGLSVGDRVVPGAGVWCGACDWCRVGRTNLCERYYTLGLQADGGLAEYLTAPAKMCRLVPDAISDDAAAITQPLAVALHAVARGEPQPGEVAVLIGAGGIGFFVLAALAHYSLGALVVVDVDEERLRGARAGGATQVINGAHADPGAVVGELTGGHGAQLVFEASGAPVAPALATRLVRRGGRVVLIGLQAAERSLDLADLVLREVDVVTTVAHICDHDLPAALDLLVDPALSTAAIDRVIPLDALVSDGLVPLSEGRVKGKVVVAPRG
jgi:(R,R)-butanediol dehydrogenase/meso-butanediol dehydrogenase/diacetyl reductase